MRMKKSVSGAKECLIWDRKHETMPRPKLEKLQLERLQKTVERCYTKVPLSIERKWML
jgi:phenylacetate-CoA ligase